MTIAKSTDFVSTPIVTIDGVDNNLMNDFRRDILQISVEESLHLPAMFIIVVNNPYAPTDQETKTWKYDEKIIQIGNIVKLGFIPSTDSSSQTEINNQYLIEGEITAIETHFTGQTQAPIVIRGYDIAHRLHRGHYIRSFQNFTDADIVKKIAEEVGINPGELDSSGKVHDYVFQENQTNMEFLRERAARIGFELFIQDGKLNFRNPKINETLKLVWLQDFTSFRVRLTSAEQVKAVEVRGWNYETKEPIVARIPKQVSDSNSYQVINQIITTTEYGKGSDYSQKFGNQPPEPKMLVVDKPIATPKEAEVMAQAIFNELEGDFICADARGMGNPQIRPGKVLELESMGRYNGKYYITESRHLYYEGIYTTEFSVRGLRGGDLLQTLSPTMRLRPGQTHLVGIVTDNKDPKGWGRVRVKFPTLTPEKDSKAHASYWARIVSMGAGLNRGFDCLPEINDEVLVAFEHGDIHRPYVIGSVWNGKDLPPENPQNSVTNNGEVRLRTFKTRTGHSLQFVENDQDNSRAGVYIKTSQGHEIRLNDSNSSIEIKTKKGESILLNESSGITIHSGSIKLEGQVEVTGSFKVTGNVEAAQFLSKPLIGSSINLGDRLTNLEKQVEQNSNGDRKSDRTLKDLKQQIQPNFQNVQDDRQTQLPESKQLQSQDQLNPTTDPPNSKNGSISEQLNN